MADWQRQQSAFGVDDLVLLQTLNEKAIMENLRGRLTKEQIYTYIGNVLISVNPFTRIRDCYSDTKVKYYRDNARTAQTPHIYALAANAVSNMISEEENQCVIISGESGAGKTEASKQIMQYIASVSPNSEQMDRVKQVMMDSNPVLEAFGNAKTVRNDNSSRFGKFMEIYFDPHGGPSGGYVRTFLLEKSRVVFQGRGDRNFHIFYQLCCADDGLKRRLKIGDPSQHQITRGGGELTRPGVSDADEFRETVEAMEKLGIDSKERDSCFRLLAAIIHLGDIQFVTQGTSCVIQNQDTLENAADLIEVESSILERSLTWKLLDVGAEKVDVQLDEQQCKEARDALAKSIYSKIFDFIVGQVNRAFDTQDQSLMIGILDIYGFEIFEKNGFEQFCINYVNEKLQQIFIELTLKVEQEEYVKEKIKWETIKYFNNKIVCDLVEGSRPPGLFALLDDTCAKMHKEEARVADIKMLDTFDGGHCGHLHYKRHEHGFQIRHYAGDVNYTAYGFTQKNKDVLPKDLLKVVTSSDDKLVQKFYKEEAEMLEDMDSPRGSPRGKRQTTAGFKIRSQAADLVHTLKKCTPHYIRCVKPNDTRTALGFVDDRVLHQVKYLGLLENVKVRRAGFSYRQHFDKFLRRFKYINSATFPRPHRCDDKTACQTILSQVPGLPAESWQLGETKVFIRQPQHVNILEDQRESAFGKIAGKIQTGWKVYKGAREMLITKQTLAQKMQAANKKRRPGSVFRVWKGDYMNYHDIVLHKNIHEIVKYPGPSMWQECDAGGGQMYYLNTQTQVSQWHKPEEQPLNHKILYAEKLCRVKDHDTAEQAYDNFIITEQNVFLAGDVHELVTPPPLEKPTKKNPNPPPMYPPYWLTHTCCKKRMPIQYLRAISLSLQADNYLVLHFYDYPDQVLYQPPAPKVEPKASKKEEKKKKEKPVKAKKGKKGAEPEPEPAPQPEEQWQFPQQRVDKDPHEPCEDVILITQFKTEIVGVLCQQYRRFMQNELPVQFMDTIDYVTKTAGTQVSRQLICYENWQMLEPQIYVQGPNQLVAHCPSGLEYSRVQQLEGERDRRRAAARDRFQKEQAEAKRKEEEAEKQREAERKRLVEQRKREKEEEERRLAAEEEERERKRQERKARAAKIVAEKSTTNNDDTPAWMKKK